MKVRNKIFLSMASLIIGMAVLYALLTNVIVSDILTYMLDVDREQQMTDLSQAAIDSYVQHGESWSEIDRLTLPKEYSPYLGASFLLLNPDQVELVREGEFKRELMTYLGLHQKIMYEDAVIAELYYIDDEVSNISLLKTGVNSSVIFFLIAGCILFAIIALIVAYWLSNKLTSPLRQLIPAIDRLAGGDYDARVQATSRDEYGTVAQSFNAMSEQLQRTEKLRSNLVADVAHELRTPIAIITGKLEMLQLQGKPVPPETLLPVQDELIRLTRLVDDLHQLSLTEAKRITFDMQATDIAHLLDRVIEHTTDSAVEKDITLTLHQETERTTLDADPQRITQVFLNLFTNAIRYTPEGGRITVTMREVRDVHTNTTCLQTIIADTGIGIAAEHLPFVFERFYRTDDARSRDHGGTGLGLAIAREVVLGHQGNIEVSSNLGQGTTFTITIPFVQCDT